MGWILALIKVNQLYNIFTGSGRVTFCSHKSYMKAVNAAFVEIKNPKFVKKVQC